MSHNLKPGTRLRQLMAQKTVVLPGVFNAIMARLAEATGFEAVYISGAGVTNAQTCLPDIGLLTLTEMAQQARYICQAVPIPCIADADTGYGETHNVMRAVQELEAAGLAGIHLEDQVSPKRCGHLEGKHIVPPAEMARKIAAAVKARHDPDFLLIARTDARGATNFEDAVARAHLYLEAGADAIFPEALQSAEEFAEFARCVPAPLMANMTEFGKSPLLTVSQLAEMGYRMILFPMTLFRVMMKAAEDTLRELKATGTQKALLDRMQTRAELYELIRYADYQAFDSQIAAQFPLTKPSDHRG